MTKSTNDDKKIPSSGLLLGSEPVDEIRDNRIVAADRNTLADGDSKDADGTDADGTDGDGTDGGDADGTDADTTDSKDADGKD